MRQRSRCKARPEENVFRENNPRRFARSGFVLTSWCFTWMTTAKGKCFPHVPLLRHAHNIRAVMTEILCLVPARQVDSYDHLHSENDVFPHVSAPWTKTAKTKEPMDNHEGIVHAKLRLWGLRVGRSSRQGPNFDRLAEISLELFRGDEGLGYSDVRPKILRHPLARRSTLRRISIRSISRGHGPGGYGLGPQLFAHPLRLLTLLVVFVVKKTLLWSLAVCSHLSPLLTPARGLPCSPRARVYPFNEWWCSCTLFV